MRWQKAHSGIRQTPGQADPCRLPGTAESSCGRSGDRPRTFLILALLVAVMVCCGGCDGPEAPGTGRGEGGPVVTYQVMREEPLPMTSMLPGRVQALVVAEVRPQVDGIIRERLFEEGSQVTRGQVLYQLDPALYQADYNTAKAALNEALASVEALRMQERRSRQLATTNAVSQQALEKAISDHAQARARVDKARAELERAAINLDYTRITAPVSGRIGASSVTQGTLVTANQSTALATIQQVDRVYVDLSQSSAETIRLRKAMARGTVSTDGRVGRVRLLLEDGTPYTPVSALGSVRAPTGAFLADEDGIPWIEGELLFSEILVGEATGSVRLRAIFENPDQLLLPGMYVTAVLLEGVRKRAILVPQACVLSNSEGRHFVYVLADPVQDGAHSLPAGAGAGADGEQDRKARLLRVQRRYVELGRTVGSNRIVETGLARGDRVVIDGLQKVQDQSDILAIERQKPADGSRAAGGREGKAPAAATDGQPGAGPGDTGDGRG